MSQLPSSPSQTSTPPQPSAPPQPSEHPHSPVHPQPSVHPLATHRWGVVILATLTVFGPIAVDLYLPALPTIAQTFNVGAGPIQWTLSAYLIGFCIGMLTYGPVSDAWGRRPITVLGLLIFIGASIGCAWASSVETLVLWRFIQAVGGGAVAVMGRAMVRDIFPGSIGARAMSLVALVTAITPMMAPLAGGQILRWFGWPALFVALALYAVAVLALTLTTIPESLPPRHRHTLRISAVIGIYWRLLTDRQAWGCVLCAGGTFAAMFAYITGSPFVFIEFYRVPADLYGVLFGINIVAQMIGTYSNSRWVGHIDALTISRWAALLAVAGGLLLGLAGLTGIGGLWGIIVPLLLVVGVTVIQSSNMTVRITLLYPSHVGAAAAALTSSMFGFGALSSLCVSLIDDGTPFAMTTVVCLSTLVAGLGTLSLFSRPTKVSAPAP